VISKGFGNLGGLTSILVTMEAERKVPKLEKGKKKNLLSWGKVSYFRLGEEVWLIPSKITKRERESHAQRREKRKRFQVRKGGGVVKPAN